ncbi:hypothetical protein KI387_019260, partial [Taxus chinensis]
MDLLLLYLLLFLSFCIVLTRAHSEAVWNNVSDQQSLLGFKAQITFDPNNFFSGWSPNTSFCEWRGVICFPHVERVRALNISGMDLEGAISPLIGNLSSLQSLDVSNNALGGPIPPQLGRLSNAEELLLYGNHLEGDIPASLSGCRRLVTFAASYNRLQGSVPAELALLTHLERLFLGVNFLKGTIPSSLGNLTSLIYLTLEKNNLTGSIPVEVGMLTRLQTVYLHTNQLSGTIPSSIGNLTTMTNLELSINNLRGSIPVNIGMLTKLQTVYLHTNQLSGTIPSSLGNLTAMTDLEFSINNLRGSIPVNIGMLANLTELILWGNQLSGDIPNSIGNCSKLRFLILNDNRLSGMVPLALGKLPLLKTLFLFSNELVSGNSRSLPFLTALTNCSNLEFLSVANNSLSGVLPASIGHLSSKLSELVLAYNQIIGSIPREITNLSNLTYLRLDNNLLSGSIPYGIKNFQLLERFILTRNRLEGNISDEIGQLKSLGLLDVSWNQLSGGIPDSLGELQQLRRLVLHHNRFSGAIPVGLSRCPNLELVDFSHNELEGNIPGEFLTSLKNIQFYLNLSWNFFQGPLPKEISSIVSAQAIDISGNQLGEEIPGVLGNCIALEHLNLSHNAFSGPIPDALGKLQNLQDIDFSSNFLSGAIPVSLRQLKFLGYINLCFNNLSGSIPEEDLFSNKTVTELFTGNPGLCGPKRYLLPACLKHRKGEPSPHIKIILSVAGVSTFVLCSIVLGILWRHKFSRQQFDPSNFMFGRLGYPKFSYQDLVLATNGFNQTNLLGQGSFGSVYKGILRNDRVVAIKVLNVQNEEDEKIFKSECKILGRIRHRNLIRVISACSYPGFKGLVLQYASNGSLEKHLYPHSNEEDVCQLGLAECLNIAIDVAHGIEYLHHDCPIQVVHRDLKPNNVLLDADMAAIVTDFGISNLTSSTNSMDSLHSSFSLRGSIGYIAPEYGLDGRVSTKGDVYSYGILLLEMVTRKKPTDVMFVGDLNLQKWVRSALLDRLDDIVDSRLLRSVNIKQNRCLISFIHVGLLCTNESPQDRPTMRDVGRGLESLRSTFMGSVAATSNLTTTILDL